MKIIYVIILAFISNLTYSQGSTCATADPFCAGSSNLIFPNTTGQPNGNDIACLGTMPNSSWFYLQIGNSGNLLMNLVQNTSFNAAGNPTGTPLDVDFVVWGPFNQGGNYCSQIVMDDCPTCPSNVTNPNFYPFGNIVDCSYSGNAQETMTINNAVSGQIYIVLITNYDGDPGFIKMNQTGGTGTTNCDIVCPLSIAGGNVSTCANTTLTIIYQNATAPTYQWFYNSVLIPGATGATYVPTVAGTYSVVANSPGCSANQPASTIIYDPVPPPIQPPNDLTLCVPGPTNLFNLASNTAVILTGLTASDYEVNYHTTLIGAQNVDGSIPNPSAYPGLDGQIIYISIQDFTSGGCISTTQFTLHLSSCGLTPVPPPDMSLCDDASNDGIAIFDLTQQNTTILGSYTPSSNYNITYHLTFSDAQNDINAISPANAYANTSNPQTIYVRMEEVAAPTTFGTTDFDLIVNAMPTVTVNNPAICAGASATVTATPGIAGTYSYSWTVPAGATAPGDVSTFTTTTAGTYSVIITNTTTTCVSASASGNVTVDVLPTVTVNSPTVCSGTNATVTATPGTAGTYSYAWTVPTGVTAPGNVPTFNTATAGTYSVIITNTTTTCISASASGTVTINPLPTVTVNSPTICSGANATVTATPGTAGTYSYVWTVPAGAGAPGNVSTFTTTTAGTYSVIITDTTTTCASASASGTVTINPLPTVTVNSPTICSGANATVTATPGTAGTYSYVWTVPAGATAPGDVSTFTTTTAGTYSVIITNTTTTCVSASASGTATVNPSPTVTVNSPTVCSGINATVTATPGTPGTYSYVWTVPAGATAPGNVSTFTTTTAGTYSVIITDTTTTCVSASASGTVTINPSPTVTVNSPTVCSGTNATVTATPGTPGTYSYAWTVPAGATAPGDVSTFTTNTAGTYSVIITDATTTTTCVSTSASGIVTINPLPTVTVNSPTVCSGTNATVTATPGTAGTYSYAWTIPAGATAPGNVASFTTTTSGTYSVIITDTTTTCASASASGTVTINPLPTVTVTSSTVCSGTNATVTATPGTAGTYSYAWTVPAGATAPGDVASFTTTTVGTYSVIITDTTTTCTSASASGTVMVNPLPTATISGTTTICSGSSTTVTFNGTPNAIVTYNINNGGDLFTTLDGNGTSAVATGNLTAQTVYNLVSVSTSTGVPLCSQNQTGSATVSIVTLPVITNPTPLQVCDDNNDGFSTFMLTSKDLEITGGQANLVVSYHETPTDAQTGANSQASPYPNINAGSQTIYVRVYDVAAPQCASFTTLQLIVNPRPIPNPVISDYVLCDINNPGDGVENFNLPTKSLEILNGQTGSAVTYYTTQLDAQNETNPIDTTVLYPNTGNPQQIWIRMENTTTGCFSVSSFQLVVNPLPTVVAPSPMNACSNGVPNTAEFNLALNDSNISGGTPNVTVSYYLTLSDAQNEVNSLAIPYTNISNPQTVYVRVENNTTGCYDTTSLVLNVTQGPTANTPTALEVCDPNSDGFSAFNLESASNEIGGGSVPAGVTITYHETVTDAQNGTNALTSPYTNIVVNTQPIYVRVSYALTGCSNFVTLQLIVHSTPEATEIAPLEVCDDNADGLASFNLTTATAGILGSLDPAQHTVSYYVLQADAQSGTNPISNVLNYVNVTPNAQTIWVRVEHNTTGCFDVVSLGLIVNPLPSAPFPVPSYSLCDYNNPGDEQEEFDLSTKIPQIIGTQTGVTVTFHVSAADATAGTNALPNLYTNISNAQTLHVRVTNATTQCFVITTMDIRVEPLPSPVAPPAPLSECDADGDGFAAFNLDAEIQAMLNGAPNTVITFHETLQDANNGNNDLTSPYTNIVSFVQFVYVRAENTLTGCYSVIQIELNVNPSPVIPSSAVLPDLTECDADNNNQNGFTAFDLTVQTPILLAAQSGPASDYEIRYYTSEANAQSGTNPIIAEDNFINTVNPQTIWVRVNNTATGCYSVGTFQLIVGIPLALTTPAPLSLCDDGATTTIPTRVFDLTVKNNEITQNLPGYTVAYYYPDASIATNLITDPTAYTNVTNAQTLEVEVTSAAGCKSYTTLTIRVLPLPTPETDPQELVECDDNNSPNGTELFDLTTNESYIANGDPGLTFEYYLSESDANAQDNMIATPTAYEVGTTIIWIRVMNTQMDSSGSNCYVLVQQSILVNPLPIVAANPTYTYCDTSMTGIATFTLSEMNDDLLGTTQNVSDFTITYHLLQSEAQTGANPLPNSYNNISNPQDIYARIVNNTTGCVNATGIVTLRVAAGATAAAPAAFATCDYDFTTANGIYTIDLTQFDAEALAGQDSTLFTVAYFATEADAIAGTNVITTPTAYPVSTGMVWIVVTNDTTSCRSTPATVSITVEPLAEPVIESIPNGSNTICVEWGTNELLSGLTLDSGITDTNYTFQWFLNGQPLPGGTNATYVIDTVAPGEYTVIATSTSTLACISNLSAPFPVIQSGPAVLIGTGYTISNAFADNQVITVTVEGHGDYHYQLDNGPILDNGGVFENVGPGPHTILVHDVKGNTTCGSLLIEDIQSINYPNYFTPNGDGIHDTWNIIGLSSQPNAKIYIFDRYGKLIKQISPTSTGGWDGTYNGQLMPSSDYWFTVDYLETGVNKVFKAHFSLKR